MDGEFNETYITFGGHVDIEKNRYLYFCIIFVAYILIILFNSTIVCLIWIHRNLHEPMYIFIAALLINSVLFSTNIYPKLLIDFLSEKQIISFPTCLLQFFIVYSLAGAEFLLLSAMAYDRYVSICKPLQYATIMSKNTVCIILGLAWLLPCCHTVVPVVLTAPTKHCKSTLNGILCNNTMYGLYCVRPRAQSIFGSIFLVIAALCPILFILFTYTRIFLITYRGNKEVRKKAAETCLPHLLVLISFSCLCAYDVIIVRLGSNFPKTARFIMTLQIILYHPLFNPIIYGLKMKEISKHLKRLFCQTKAM